MIYLGSQDGFILTLTPILTRTKPGFLTDCGCGSSGVQNNQVHRSYCGVVNKKVYLEYFLFFIYFWEKEKNISSLTQPLNYFYQ